jgi:predicted esterase
VSSVTVHTIAAATHGRMLVQGPSDIEPNRVIIGFHGYGEAAESQLARLQSIPGADRALLVSIQGLHRFYRGRGTDVVASWMTRQDRELALVDNRRYVESALTAANPLGRTAPHVYAGFSQGVAMAFRAACSANLPPGSVIAAGGDIPPELDARALARVTAVLIGRGGRDTWYTAEKCAQDCQRLQTAGVNVSVVELDADHEWTPEFSREAGSFLERA